MIARLVEELSLEGDLGTLVESVERAKAREGPPIPDSPAGPVATLLAAYEARCREVNAFDFTDLLAAPLTSSTRIPRFARGCAHDSAPSWSTRRRTCVRSSMHWSKRSRRRTVPSPSRATTTRRSTGGGAAT